MPILHCNMILLPPSNLPFITLPALISLYWVLRIWNVCSGYLVLVDWPHVVPLWPWRLGFSVLGVLGLSSGGVTMTEKFRPGNGNPLASVTYTHLIYPLTHLTYLEWWARFGFFGGNPPPCNWHRVHVPEQAVCDHSILFPGVVPGSAPTTNKTNRNWIILWWLMFKSASEYNWSVKLVWKYCILKG